MKENFGVKSVKSPRRRKKTSVKSSRRKKTSVKSRRRKKTSVKSRRRKKNRSKRSVRFNLSNPKQLRKYLNSRPPIFTNLIPTADALSICRGEGDLKVEDFEDFDERAADWVVEFFENISWDEDFVRKWAGTAIFSETMGDRLIHAVDEIGQARGDRLAVSRFISGLMNVMYESRMFLFVRTYFHQDFPTELGYNFFDENGNKINGYNISSDTFNDILEDIKPPVVFHRSIATKNKLLIRLFNEYRKEHKSTLQDWIILWAMFTNESLLLGDGVTGIDVIGSMVYLPGVPVEKAVDELCNLCQDLVSPRIPLQQIADIDMKPKRRPDSKMKVETLIPRIRI